MTERNQKDWRELCAAVVNETDSGKFDSLVEQLIQALDDDEQDWRPRADQPHEAIQRLVAMPTSEVDRQVARGIQLRLERLRCELMRATRTSGIRISEYIAELSRRLAPALRRTAWSRRNRNGIHYFYRRPESQTRRERPDQGG